MAISDAATVIWSAAPLIAPTVRVSWSFMLPSAVTSCPISSSGAGGSFTIRLPAAIESAASRAASSGRNRRRANHTPSARLMASASSVVDQISARYWRSDALARSAAASASLRSLSWSAVASRDSA